MAPFIVCTCYYNSCHIRKKFVKWTVFVGVPVTYTHWLPGRKGNHEPHREEDCVEFIPYRNHGAWDDIPCGEYNLYSQDEGYTKNFICQNCKSLL